MKVGDQKIISACHKIAAQHNMQERIIYSSFDHYLVRRMHEFDPSTFVAPLIMHVSPLDPAQYCAGLGARAIHPLYTQLRYADGYIVALQNAASIASTVLTTEAVVSDKKEDKPAPAAPAGMDGMY